VLIEAHDIRNRIEYEGAIAPNEKLVEAMLRITREVAKRVRVLR